MLNTNIQKKYSSINGFGLFAGEDIKKGEPIWKEDKGTKSPSKRFSQEVQDMNHSCRPNTWFNGDDEIIARKNIKKGEEITYDYSTFEIKDWDAPMNCNCGSKSCRRVVTEWDILNPRLQEEYKGHLPSWILKFIKSRS